MTRKASVWMPMYWGDYFRDTRHLDITEHGAYLLLIGHYWINGKGIANVDKRLATIVGMTLDSWVKIRPTIEEFFTIKDGIWRHSRIDAEIKSSQTKANARSQAGKRGAAARWQTHNNRNANANGKTMLSRATPSPVEEEETNANALAKKPDMPDLPEFLKRTANKPKGAKNVRPGSRCPTDLETTEQDIEYARSRGLDGPATAREWESYVAHFTAGQGRNKTATNWHGGNSHWGTWCRNAEKFAAERMANRPSDNGSVAAVRELMAQG